MFYSHSQPPALSPVKQDNHSQRGVIQCSATTQYSSGVYYWHQLERGIAHNPTQCRSIIITYTALTRRIDACDLSEHSKTTSPRQKAN